MSNTDDLNQKIIADLKKSGFGSEMQVLSSFLKAGWECQGGASYVDKDTRQSREYDCLAQFFSAYALPNESNLRVFTDVVVEVKKSDRPWVVFSHPTADEELRGGWKEAVVFGEDLPYSAYTLTKVFDQHSLAGTTGWLGYALHESFKNPEQPSRWYPAFVTVCKAAEYQLTTNEEEDRYFRRTESPDILEHPTLVHIVQPLVVVDGPLFVAELVDADNIGVKEIEYAAISFHFSSAAYSEESYRVAVCTLSGLGSLIAHFERRHVAIFKSVVAGARALVKTSS